MKKLSIIVFLLICATFSYAQTIRVRSLEPTNKEPVTLPGYDTTSVFLDLSKLSDNIHYFDGQKILISPNTGDMVEYTHDLSFTVKDSIEMRNHPDTVWIKKRKKIREGDFYVVYPKTIAYKPEYVENGIVRKIGGESVNEFYRKSGFYTPSNYINGKEFTIESISQLHEYFTGIEYCMHLIDDEGNAVDFTFEMNHNHYKKEDFYPSIFMMAYIDKYREKYVGKTFHVNDLSAFKSTIYLFKNIATDKYVVVDGDLTCVDLSIIKGGYSLARIDDQYESVYRSDIRLFFKDKNGNEFCVPIESKVNNLLSLSKYSYEDYIYGNVYYLIQLDDMVLSSDYYAQKEAKRIAEENRLAEEQQQKIERKNKLIKKYGKTYAEIILNGQVQTGMSAEMCRESWGIPDDINRSIGPWGTHEQWCYDWGGYLYMENGVLKSIQN